MLAPPPSAVALYNMHALPTCSYLAQIYRLFERMLEAERHAYNKVLQFPVAVKDALSARDWGFI